MELTEQLARFLHDKGLGIFNPDGVGGTIFINTLPSDPDESMAIYTTGGPGSDPLNEYGRNNIQVLIRTTPNDPRIGETKAKTLINLLNGFSHDYLTPGGNYMVDVSPIQSGPNNIGKDQNNRFEFSQNFTFEFVK